MIVRARNAQGELRPAIVLPLCLCLCVGLLSAVASSIICVLWPAFAPGGGGAPPRVSVRYDLPDDQTIYVYRAPRTGYLLVSVSGPMPTFVADVLDKDRSQHIPVVEEDPRPRWMRSPLFEEPQTSRGIAAGWPMHVFWGRSDRNVNERPQQVSSGILQVTIKGAVRSFPARPLWLGLILNTLCYSGVCLVVWFASVIVPRMWRTARGRCPRCGYPRATADQGPGAARCPECGLVFQPTAAGSSRAGVASSASSLQTTSTFTSKSSSSEDK